MFIGKNLEYVRKLNALSRKGLSEKINVSEQFGNMKQKI